MVKTPDIETIMALLAEGLTYQEVGDRFGVTRQQIGSKIAYSGRAAQANHYSQLRREKQDARIATRIQSFVEQGWDAAMIADETGITLHHVRRVMAARGWKSTTHPRMKQLQQARYDFARDDRIVALRNQGKQCKEIATLTGCSTATVSRILRQSGLRTYPRRSRTHHAEDVVLLLQSGLTRSQIAIKLGLTPSTVSYHISRAMKTGVL